MKPHLYLKHLVLCALLAFLLPLCASAQSPDTQGHSPDTTATYVQDNQPQETSTEQQKEDKMMNVLWIMLYITFIPLIIAYATDLTHKVKEIKQKKKAKAAHESDDGSEEEDTRQVSITITCDEGYTADFLRELANEIECRAGDDDEQEDFEYETFHGCAEITTEN